MRVEEVTFTTADAFRYINDPMAWGEFLDSNGLVTCKEVYAKLAEALHGVDEAWVAAHDASAAVPHEPRTCRGMRHDSVELLEFVTANPRLPPRMRQVFDLCVRDGLSLDECSRQLRIGRETVRTHLRRLRDLRKGHRT